MAPCASDADCRTEAGYVCQDAACQPRCLRDADCLAPRVCDVAAGRCAEADALGSTVEVSVLSEGLLVGAEPSEPLRFELPDDVLGVGVLVEGHGDDLLSAAELVDPDGRRLFALDDPLRSAARMFATDGATAIVLPVTPESVPRGGRYSLRLIKAGPQRSVRARLVVRRGAPDPARVRLTANVVLVGVPGLTAARAGSDAAFGRIERRVRTLFGQVGVELAELRVCDLARAEADRLSVIDSTDGPANELSRLFELSADAGAWGCLAAPGLTWFLVDEIAGGRAGYTILGVSGGIPGPPGLPGTRHSGVAVTAAGYRSNPDRVASTMAHEAGHYLGLFHTTEAEATLFDPLDDTPRCEQGRDADGDGVLAYEECLGAGAENLMFWAAGPAAAELSPTQGFVLRRSPAVR